MIENKPETIVIHDCMKNGFYYKADRLKNQEYFNNVSLDITDDIELKVAEYCTYCGQYLYVQLSEEFKTYLIKEFDVNERQIQMVWNIAVETFRERKKNRIEERITIEVFTKDLFKEFSKFEELHVTSWRLAIFDKLLKLGAES